MKKALSVLIAVIMILGMTSVGIFADAEEHLEPSTVSESDFSDDIADIEITDEKDSITEEDQEKDIELDDEAVTVDESSVIVEDTETEAAQEPVNDIQEESSDENEELLSGAKVIDSGKYGKNPDRKLTREGIVLSPGNEEARVSKILDSLAGEDGLYYNGINGFDIYDYLGYVYMGWRTTGGLWQNHIIGDFIIEELEKAGYLTTDEEVETPYGSKPASDKSSSADGDYAWLIKYQETEEKKLGMTWDPEYSSLEIRLTDENGADVEDPEVKLLAENIGGRWWAYNPKTKVYQINFAREFGMDYEKEIASLGTTSEKIRAMHDVLMSSEKERDSRTGVDDYTYIARESIAQLNKEAVLNERTRLAWESNFTDPSGTDPSEAKGLEGEMLYVGTVDCWNNTNSEGIPSEQIKGSFLLTDSSSNEALIYAYINGGIGVATITSLKSFLHPKDEEGKILEPWYDSSRYARGSGIDYRKQNGIPDDVNILEWQFSYKQYDNARMLLAKAKDDGCRVMVRQIAIGQTYPMTKTEGSPGEGQAVAIAEVKGSLHPEKRIIICAHVQEPGCCDNATGVASLLGMATQYKKLIDEGKIDRPACTITFMWGDEMNMGDYWMDGHQDETSNLIGVLDMDMAGEDPDKTGSVMRIEKTPDPSADYNYTRDEVPWEEPDNSIPSRTNPWYDKDYRDMNGNFVRLPDSDTLWGAGDTYGLYKDGWFLNDLYMYVTSTVIDRHDEEFRVDVCPFEGGSDHETFLKANIPALLTWHFTDYGYHTSSDTLYMASPEEMENVSLTTLTTALMMSELSADEDAALDVLGAVKEAAIKRMDAETINTDHHRVYVEAGYESFEDALSNEKEVLNAWGKWYNEALASVADLMDEPSEKLLTAIEAAKTAMKARTDEALKHAEHVLTPDPEPISIQDEKVVLSRTAFTYNAKVQKPVIKTIGEKKLKEGTDYTVVWSNASSKNAGYYTLSITGTGLYCGTTRAKYKINKVSNPITVKRKTAVVNYNKLKEKAQCFKLYASVSEKAKTSFKLISVRKGKKSFAKYFKVSSDGKVTVKKGLAKGKYTLKVKVTAAKTKNYLKTTRTKTLIVTIK